MATLHAKWMWYPRKYIDYPPRHWRKAHYGSCDSVAAFAPEGSHLVIHLNHPTRENEQRTAKKQLSKIRKWLKERNISVEFKYHRTVEKRMSDLLEES